MDPVTKLRCLASNINAVIQSKPDVLGGHIVKVPELSTAEFANQLFPLLTFLELKLNLQIRLTELTFKAV